MMQELAEIRITKFAIFRLQYNYCFSKKRGLFVINVFGK